MIEKIEISNIVEKRLKKNNFQPIFFKNLQLSYKNRFTEVSIFFTIIPIYFPIKELLYYFYHDLFHDLNPRNKGKFEITYDKRDSILTFYIEKKYANNIVRKEKIKKIIYD